MSPQFIYFDLGNVLCYFDHRIGSRQIAELAGLPEPQVWELVFGGDGLLWKYERGELTDDGFHEAFSKATGTKTDAAAFHHANSDIFKFNATILPLVSALEDSGMPLGILSNICGMHWRTVSDGRYSIIPKSFKNIVLSCESGALKPDPKIYERAIQMAGVPAERIFYTDDIPGHVEGAKRAGMDAVQYTTTGALIEELWKRGVRCNV